jgi:hypothetical protein
MAKIEEEAASDLLEEKIGNLNTLKEEVQVWEAKFKVRRLKKNIATIASSKQRAELFGRKRKYLLFKRLKPLRLGATPGSFDFVYLFISHAVAPLQSQFYENSFGRILKKIKI